ncbi:MAG: S41 family peptidase [Fimbriimonadaceae bacterium]|nr:S41 family peptidase [Fimbriimonadaceae bacterium]
MKFSSLKTLLVPFALAASALSFAQSAPSPQAPPFDDEAKAKVLARVERVITQMAFVPGVDFKSFPEMIKRVEQKIKDSKTPDEFVSVINTALDDYKFSHIAMYPPSFRQMRATQSRAGIGIRIEIEEKGLRVNFVFPSSPAAEAGLQPGDLVVERDGKPVRSVADLAGAEGESSKIVIIRDSERITKEVTRRQYSTVIPETLRWEGDVAIITVPTFDRGYSRTNVSNLMAEALPKAKGVIVDLRGNGGGLVLNLQHLSGFFLDPQAEPLGTFIGRQDYDRFVNANGPTDDLMKIAQSVPMKVRAERLRNGTPFRGPVAVLIDGGSGSASEMFAGALKEHRQSALIGSRSAGAVLASLMIDINEGPGFILQIPMTDYVTHAGVRIEGNGWKPDFTTPSPRTNQVDQGIQQGLKWLRERLAPANRG